MIMKNKILTAAALAFISVACSTNVDDPVQYGQLSVALSGEPTVDVVTKAPETLLPTDENASAYMVRIYDSADAMKYESSYSAFEAQKLPLGTYYVTAENCTEADAESGNGKMRLYGRSSDVNLTADALFQTATVSCTVANAKVSVQFDESVAGRFTGLQVALSGGTTRKDPVVISQTDAKVVTETWFNPSKLTYTISGTFTSGGQNKEVNVSKEITLQAKNNVLLLVKVNLENGQLVPSVTIDTQIDDIKEIPEEFNPYI
jgi:hypothetical protein